MDTVTSLPVQSSHVSHATDPRICSHTSSIIPADTKRSLTTLRYSSICCWKKTIQSKMKFKNWQINFDCDMTGQPETLERSLVVLDRKILLQPLRLVTVHLFCSALFFLSCPVLSYPILSCPILPCPILSYSVQLLHNP